MRVFTSRYLLKKGLISELYRVFGVYFNGWGVYTQFIAKNQYTITIHHNKSGEVYDEKQK